MSKLRPASTLLEWIQRHYDEAALAWLVFEVAVANLYNRLNVATRKVAVTQRW
jgi:hypothetical protein